MISSTVANRLLFILSLAGVGVAAYLTLAHMDVLSLVCGRSNGCEEVALHPSSHGFGISFLSAIPTAAFGLAAYIVLAGLSFARVASASLAFQQRAASLQWLFALIGVLISGWLTYMEAYVIHAWCRWCVASAVIMALIFIISSAERIGRRVEPARLAPEGEIP